MKRAADSRLSFVDLAGEASANVRSQLFKTLLAALGTVLGVGAFLATVGISSSAKQQISARFDRVAATQLTVTDLGTGNLPEDAETRARRLDGVREAGTSWLVDQGAAVGDGAGSADQDPTSTQPLPLFAASPHGLAAVGGKVLAGREFDSGMEARRDRVALVGSVAAKDLGISDVSRQPAVFIDGTAFSVIGILFEAPLQPGALTGLVIPAATARELHPIERTSASGAARASNADATGSHTPALFVTTRPGAAQVVGGELLAAVAPRDDGDLDVSAPPDPRTLRRAVEGTTSQLVSLVAGVALLIGIVAIANASLMSVLERIPEIGLRRALGARPIHIATAVLAESSLVGAIGGSIGALLGLVVTTAVAFARTWTAVLDLRLVAVAPLVGLAAGMLAGLYPAWRATRVEPVVALQYE